VLHTLIPILAGLGRGTGETLKLYKTWHQLVTGKRNPLLDRLLRELDEEQARQVISSVEMHLDLPEDIAHWIRGGIRERFPSMILVKDVPFWERDYIYCTQAGIARRKEELRVLLEEKLPENSKAIGRAAALGDLSENAEWQAAIEDRGLLSDRAQTLQAEVDKARPLEKAPIPPGVVAPGCRIVLRDGNGTEREMVLLGPWDQGDERVVSYRSPLAEGLLGTKVGEEATVVLPDGEKTWKVQSVEIAI
jgi:transcription elongation factor GreA